MNDKKIKELMAEYQVPDSTQSQLETIAKKTIAAMPTSRNTKPFSVFEQLRVQATYLSKWFYVACTILMVGCLVANFYSDLRYQSSLFFSFGPLFILPSVGAVYRLFADKMYELEASCKYNFVKILTGKLLLLSTCTAISLVILWLMAAALTGIWDVRHILFALVSFSVTCGVILCFGKRSIMRGFIGGALWAGIVFALALWNKGRIIIEAMSMGVVALILLLSLCVTAYMAYRFMKNLNIGESTLWNYVLTE